MQPEALHTHGEVHANIYERLTFHVDSVKLHSKKSEQTEKQQQKSCFYQGSRLLI